jgi:para-nitrobenzyl esterase
VLEVAVGPIVGTRQGAVRGTVSDGIHIFRGIPYAAPPFGPNRLRPPALPEPWTGIRDAFEDGVVAPQGSSVGTDAEGFLPPGGPVPGEDCLNLTIWTPGPGLSRVPVMVWITGGAFEFGSAAWYDGSRFARDGVVCVAINYRPGAEGFLALRDTVANRGLLDQIAALKWVRDNIAAFGGDPDRVTVCGQSAGAMSIGDLLAIPRAEGLFRRAILESGASHHVLLRSDALRIGERLAAKLGVAPARGEVAALPWDHVLAAQGDVKADLLAHPDPAAWGIEAIATSMPFHPVIDGDVVPAAPIERIRAGASAGVDVLIGTNVDDWRLFLAASGMLGQVSDDMVTGPVERYGSQSAAAYGLGTAELASYRRAPGTEIAGHLLSTIETDWWCRIPAIRLADAHAGGTGRTYMYEFAWPSPVADGLFGACHALEIPFVFDTLNAGSGQMLGGLLGDNPPQELATSMHGAWVEFISNGDPGWPAYELGKRATMRFDERSAVVDDPRRWERELWEDIR